MRERQCPGRELRSGRPELSDAQVTYAPSPGACEVQNASGKSCGMQEWNSAEPVMRALAAPLQPFRFLLHRSRTVARAETARTSAGYYSRQSDRPQDPLAESFQASSESVDCCFCLSPLRFGSRGLCPRSLAIGRGIVTQFVSRWKYVGSEDIRGARAGQFAGLMPLPIKWSTCWRSLSPGAGLWGGRAAGQARASLSKQGLRISCCIRVDFPVSR
ncbi:hypothetical protein HRbin28_01138 [bacterium HR28]|nr:hypothetical protein HRbin28_01138 [bacterium HR28]